MHTAHCAPLHSPHSTLFLINFHLRFSLALSIVQLSSFNLNVCTVSILILAWIENRRYYLLGLMVAACSYFLFIDRTFRNWSLFQSKLVFFPLPIAWAFHFFSTYILMHFSLLFVSDWLENIFGSNIEAERNKPFTSVTMLINGERYLNGDFSLIYIFCALYFIHP